MGYYAHSESADVAILRDNHAEALKALCREYPAYASNTDLAEFIYEFGLSATINRHGDIDELYYEYEKFRSDEIEHMLDVLAPFVEPGSYITFRGEDDCVWAYYFDGLERSEYQGETVFPGMPMNGPVRPERKDSPVS